MATKYTIKSGDTLSGIAAANKTTVSELMKLNPSITNANLIYAGSSINLPGTSNKTTTKTQTTTQTNKYTPTVSKETTQAKNAYTNYAANAPGAFTKSDALVGLENNLASVNQNKPIDFTSSYTDIMKQYMDQFTNRGNFNWDMQNDDLYNQYKDQYTRLGNAALKETVGEAAGLTGGYGSSYAEGVGAQAYQSYLNQLNNIVPELYAQRRAEWNEEGQNILNNYNLAAGMYQNDLSEWQQAYNNWLTERDYAQNAASNLYNQEYNEYLNNVNSYNTELDRLYNAYLNNQNRDDTIYYNSLAQEKSDEQFEYQKAQATAKASSGGSSSSSSSSSATGATDKQTQKANVIQVELRDMAANGLADNDKVKTKLDKAVAKGEITQAQADELYRFYFGTAQNNAAAKASSSSAPTAPAYMSMIDSSKFPGLALLNAGVK